MADDSPVEKANALLAVAADREAVLLLNRAASRGDPDALYTLALWHVYGHPVARSFQTARKLFDQAGRAGHKEGRRIFAVFTALGAGGIASWKAAVVLLEQAAKSDPVASRQCDLLSNMQLCPDGTPQKLPEKELLAKRPELYFVPAAFSAEECEHIAALALPRLTPSVIVDPVSGIQSPHPIRTSDGAVLGPIQQDVVTHALNVRIALLTDTREVQGEPLSVLRYTAGQEYKLHHDCLPQEPNQRVISAITYLTDGYTGGGTYFSALDRTIKAQKGNAILFRNVMPDGLPDEASRHAGCPITSGEKWICTRWIRRYPFDPWGMRQ